jgi:hypothetical protein
MSAPCSVGPEACHHPKQHQYVMACSVDNGHSLSVPLQLYSCQRIHVHVHVHVQGQHVHVHVHVHGFLQVTEEFLKQLGARPLASALSDLDKLITAQGTGDATAAQGAGAAAATAASLAGGIALQPDSSDSLARLGELLSEIQVADAVMKLDLGPDMTKTLDLITSRLGLPGVWGCGGGGGSGSSLW